MPLLEKIRSTGADVAGVHMIVSCLAALQYCYMALLFHGSDYNNSIRPNTWLHYEANIISLLRQNINNKPTTLCQDIAYVFKLTYHNRQFNHSVK